MDANSILESINTLRSYITTHVTDITKQEKLIQIHDDYIDNLINAPASAKPQFHNCFPGGYVDHVNRVIKYSIINYTLWKKGNCILGNYTLANVVFAAVMHDFGKLGEINKPYYIESTDEWRRNKLNEYYTLNPDLNYLRVPDRSLFVLSNYNCPITQDEWIAIYAHDGPYDETNLKYFNMGTITQTNIQYLLHTSDMMAMCEEKNNHKV